jgi:hypothetical protein
MRQRLNLGVFLGVLASWRSIFLVVTTTVAGCAPTTQPTPKAVVTGTRDAAARAAQYCHEHNLNWGEPVYIIQQMDGYYVEFVMQTGYKQDTHGLTVAYDGSIHE